LTDPTSIMIIRSVIASEAFREGILLRTMFYPLSFFPSVRGANEGGGGAPELAKSGAPNAWQR